MRKKLLIVVAALIMGCSHAHINMKEAALIENTPVCHSIVEVALKCDTFFVDTTPFLILKKGGFGSRRLPGTIYAISDTGVLFLPRGSYYKKPDFYPMDNIQCLIDSDNTVIYGTWGNNPVLFEKMAMICKRVSPTPSDYFFLILRPNQTVSYCIEPGEYSVLYLAFGNILTKNIDISDSLKGCNFTVKPNMTNYLGTIHLQSKYRPLPNMKTIPCKIFCEPKIYVGIPPSGGYTILDIDDYLRFGNGSHLLDSSECAKIIEDSNHGALKHTLSIQKDSLFVPMNRQKTIIHYYPLSF